MPWPNQSLGILLMIAWKKGYPFKTNSGLFWLEKVLEQWFYVLTLRKAFSKSVSKRKRERESLKFHLVEILTNNTI